ncbi:protein farnesyltransferase subunit beta [Diutina rugosa]
MEKVQKRISYILSLMENQKRRSETAPDASAKANDDDEWVSTDDAIEGALGLDDDPSKLNSDNWFEPTAPLMEASTYHSETTQLQQDTEEVVIESYNEHPSMEFLYERHVQYVSLCLTRPMPSAYTMLDANHSWMVYWLVNSFHVIKHRDSELSKELAPDDDVIANATEAWINDDGKGGIGGGVGQIGHMASTYAGVLSLVLTRRFDILERIRTGLYEWVMSLKNPNGSFKMHHNGEADTRSTYCALVVATLLNIVTDEFLVGVEAWLDQCQTFEGGFAGVPGTEAHGGYTYCALASYFLLHKEPTFKGLDVPNLTRWLVSRQFQLEGGLSGRTNKLVDACYSFWVGAAIPLIEIATKTEQLFNRYALKSYLLRVAQNSRGGFKDKPGKSVDFYHTNYSLMGLSMCEYLTKLKTDDANELMAFRFHHEPLADDVHTEATNPVFGLPEVFVSDCRGHFQQLDGH